MDCSPPGPSVHVFLWGRILEWIAMPSSRGFSDPGIELASVMSNLYWQAGSLPLAPPGKQSSPREGPSFCIYFKDMWELTKTQFNLVKDWSPPYPTSEMFVLTRKVKWSLRSLSNLGGCDSNFKVLMAPIVFSQWVRFVRSAGVYGPWLWIQSIFCTFTESHSWSREKWPFCATFFREQMWCW